MNDLFFSYFTNNIQVRLFLFQAVTSMWFAFHIFLKVCFPAFPFHPITILLKMLWSLFKCKDPWKN